MKETLCPEIVGENQFTLPFNSIILSLMSWMFKKFESFEKRFWFLISNDY